MAVALTGFRASTALGGDMNRTLRMMCGALAAATVVIGGSHATMASEPANNSFTFSSSQYAGDFESLIVTGSASFSEGLLSGSLSSSSDVDYIVVSCTVPSVPIVDDIQ